MVSGGWTLLLVAGACLVLLAYGLGLQHGRRRERRERADRQRLDAAVAGVTERRRAS